MKLAIIGCGNLGRALTAGFIEQGQFQPEDIIVTRRRTEGLQDLAEQGVVVSDDNKEAVRFADYILVALKPHHILGILEGLKLSLVERGVPICSLATGISLQQLEDVLGSDFPLIRAMPNTAADVQQSMTCLCANESAQNEIPRVQELFSAVGQSLEIPESLMESATVLGACGIAFVLRFVRAMTQAGIEIGFDAQSASQIVNQTVKGAAELLITRKTHPEFEIDKVTTPRGCTITGLNEMEHHGMSSALIKGIVSSYQKIS
jgi:pyrroline-5-carboxylate reductase